MDTLPGEDVTRAQTHYTVHEMDEHMDKQPLAKGVMMAQVRKQLLIGLTALGVGVASLGVYAHEYAHGHAHDSGHEDVGGPAAHAAHGERMKERMEKRRTELQDKLKLDSDQQKAWERYIAKAKPAIERKKLDRAELDKLPAPERMERMLAKLKQREARMVERVAATKELYAVLTPEQKKIFDDEFKPAHFHMRHHRRGEGEHRHRHHHHSQDEPAK